MGNRMGARVMMVTWICTPLPKMPLSSSAMSEASYRSQRSVYLGWGKGKGKGKG